MDDIARYNKARWEELAQANVGYSRPFLDLDAASARKLVDPYGVMGDVRGKDVLCLASGGGQQSVAFALLGAHVTVLDLSETQLQRDRAAAQHYGVQIEIGQGDMRDLSRFANASFDLVWHAFSINFVPQIQPVFREVARVLRDGGLYRIESHNPFIIGMSEEDWNGVGYSLRAAYLDGAEVVFDDPYWTFEGYDGSRERVQAPREFRHSLSSIVNGLIGQGFVLLGIWEELSGDPQAQPGTWEHFKAIAPPWLTCWAAYRPGLLKERHESR
ncbi:MAG TPA: class I SAM-dependent methyltransferase [Herpetosiphonaceae bacterium]